MEEEEEKEFISWQESRLQSISNHIVEYFPKVMFFHSVIVAQVIVRSPTDFATGCVLFALLMRLVCVFGYYCNKKLIYIGAGGVEVLTNFILVFIAMGYS